MDALGGAEPYTTVRCLAALPNGEACRQPLWHAYGDEIEISHRVGNGRRFTFRMPLFHFQSTKTPCIRCGALWWAASATRPRQVVGHEIALAITALRSPEELGQIIGHNTSAHVDEPA